jgi:Tfp pilus assembly protein PilN
MIRINLLPKEEQVVKRRSGGPKLGAYAPLAIFPLVLGIVGISAALERAKLGSLESDVTEIREEVRAIQPQVDRVNRLTAKREELERRLEVIRQLDDGRFLAVRIMDNLSREMPRYLWMSNVTQSGPGNIAVSGVTFSNLIVADLMMRLERSAMFSGVDLAQTERGLIADREVIKFSITSLLTPDESPADFTADVALGEEE